MNRWIVYKADRERGFCFAREEETGREALVHFSGYCENFRFDDGLRSVGLRDNSTLPKIGDPLYGRVRTVQNRLTLAIWVYVIDHDYAVAWDNRKTYLSARRFRAQTERDRISA